MKTTTKANRVAVGSMLVLLAVPSIESSLSAQPVDPLGERIMGFAPIAVLGVMASGAAEDTLNACMARIPEVASAGQRMLAEQSCAGEEETRKAIRSAPKF
ncbi:MAG TPA: hypothetical protein VFX56_04950 [Nitrospira sp.]|nr:hypothetical protein [Nitrospira sp.]